MASLVAPLLQKTDPNEGITNFLKGFSLVAALNEKQIRDQAQAQHYIDETALRQQQLTIQAENQQRDDALAKERMGNLITRNQDLTEYRTKLGDQKDRELGLKTDVLKLQTEKVKNELDEQAAKVWVQRNGLFNKELSSYGVPLQAIDDPAAWTKTKEGKLSMTVPVRDATGAPQYSNIDPATGATLPAARPIEKTLEVHPKQLAEWRATRDDLKKTQPNGRYLPPADSAPTLSAEDQTALNWARSNPDDPRAGAIFKKLGTQ